MEVSFREIIVAFIFSHPVGWGGVVWGSCDSGWGFSLPPLLGAAGAAASHKREEAEAEVSVKVLDSACLLSLLGPSA